MLWPHVGVGAAVAAPGGGQRSCRQPLTRCVLTPPAYVLGQVLLRSCGSLQMGHAPARMRRGHTARSHGVKCVAVGGFCGQWQQQRRQQACRPY